MKPFNLEEAKAGKKVVTRDGREYKFGAHNPEADELCRISGWIGKTAYTHFDDGRHFVIGGADDLFMAEEEVWVNVYESHNGKILVGAGYPSQSDAETLAKGDSPYFKTVKTIRLKP